MSIKNAYQTLVDSQARSKYDSTVNTERKNDGSTWNSAFKQKEDFYGIGDFCLRCNQFIKCSIWKP